MTIRVNVADLANLAELLAHIDAGEDFVLTRNGEDVASVNTTKAAPKPRGKRIPGVWAKYGQLQDPDLFLRPDPELEAMMDEPIFPVRK
jgi:antitoxin (DNA-binding transcriptional repressor) of toxin-antitoxin stability system